MLTINQALKQLEKAKALLGGDKILTVSLTASGLEEVDGLSLKIIDEGESKYVQIRVKGFEGIDDRII